MILMIKCFIFTIAGLYSSAQAEEAQVSTRSVCLNFRSSASTSSRIISCIPKDRRVLIAGARVGGFTPVIVNGQRGYMYSQYLRPVPSLQDESLLPERTIRAEVQTAGGCLNFRREARRRASRISCVRPNQEVEILDDIPENGFYKVRYNGSVGYMYSDYIKALPAPSVRISTNSPSLPPTLASAPAHLATSSTRRPDEQAVPVVFPEEDSRQTDRERWVYERIKHWIGVEGSDLISSTPSDVLRYCPNYRALNQTERKELWATILTVVAKYESDFDADQVYVESFADSSGRRVRSTGIFQISLESSQGYRCPIQSQEDLTNPDTNIMCSVRIANQWVGRDGEVTGGSKGLGRYWSVARGISSHSRHAISEMEAKGRDYCNNVARQMASGAEPRDRSVL